MGKRKNGGSDLKPGICKRATLREESLGKKEIDVSSILKIKHLQKLAIWAGGEGGISPLGALFGHHMASTAEASGVPLNKHFFCCQRCESILQPGFNCTIRIEKCTNKRRQSQNNVIYNCNFCRHRNSTKGTLRGHIKALISLKKLEASVPVLDSKQDSRIDDKEDHALQASTDSRAREFSSDGNASATSAQKPANLSANKRKQSELGSEVSVSGNGSSRRKRKAWSSLKDIVERTETESNQSVNNFVIPFYMQQEKEML